MERMNGIKSIVMGGEIVDVEYSLYGEHRDEVFIEGVWIGEKLMDASCFSGSVISELTSKVEDSLAAESENRQAA